MLLRPHTPEYSLLNATVLEIGVYVGYSAMVWSHAVGPEGRVTGLEFESKYAKIANDAFAANRIMNVEIVVGPAAET